MYINARILLSLSLTLHMLPAFAEPQSAQAQTQSRPTTPTKKTGHFLRAGEVGYGTKIANLPESYPLPVPPGATAGLMQNVVTEKGTGYYLRLHAQHSRSELIDWYLSQLKSSGWRVEQPVHSDKAVSVSCNKQNGPAALIMFFNAPKGGTEIITNVTP
jgi:hypothetical protein